MRVGFSILKEIKDKRAHINEDVYGLKDFEFDRKLKLLERKGYVERVLRVGDNLSLRPARLTAKGEAFLMGHADLADDYPSHVEDLKEWVLLDKLMYANGAEENERG